MQPFDALGVGLNELEYPLLGKPVFLRLFLVDAALAYDKLVQGKGFRLRTCKSPKILSSKSNFFHGAPFVLL